MISQGPTAQKLLKNSGVKLSSMATDIMGVSGRAMIEALIRGDRDVPVPRLFSVPRCRSGGRCY